MEVMMPARGTILAARPASMPIKVVQLSASVSRRAGGLYLSVRRLAQELAASGEAEVEILGVADQFTKVDAHAWGSLSVRAFAPVGPAAFGYAPGLTKALHESHCNLAHTQGLWMYPSLAVRQWAKTTGLPYMVTPRGMLDDWALANARLKKKLASWAYENAHLQGAACLHALCDAEAEAIRRYGLRNPICIIPNGVDLPTKGPTPAARWQEDLPSGARVLLFLGRLHPKKGLPILLDAWAEVQDLVRHGAWYLVIAGWDQVGHRVELETQVRRANLTSNVLFIGPQFDEEKRATLARADGFVLPSLSEGLPMGILEAWSQGLPVLLTPGCHLPEGVARGAALQMAATPTAMATALRQFFAMTDGERHRMGAEGRALVAERFTWRNVASQMGEVYRWVLGHGSRPPTVFRD